MTEKCQFTLKSKLENFVYVPAHLKKEQSREKREKENRKVNLLSYTCSFRVSIVIDCIARGKSVY